MSLKIEVTLTESQVKAALILYMKNQGFIVDNVTFNTSVVTRGFGPGEYDTTVFSGAKLAVSPIVANRSFSSLSAQIDAMEISRLPYGGD